jgi:hypothetical protein
MAALQQHSEAEVKKHIDVFGMRTPKFDPRRAGHPWPYDEEEDEPEKILRACSTQRMHGEPIFVGGRLDRIVEVEGDGALALAMEAEREKSPFRDSERVDWWARAGQPWPK